MKWDIRKKIFAFMLAGSIFCLLSFCVLLLSQFLSLNRHISEKTSEMQTSVTEYVENFAQEHTRSKLEGMTKLNAQIVDYWISSVQWDVQDLSHEVTTILHNPGNYIPQPLPNANEEIILSGQPFCSYSPQLLRDGITAETAREIQLLANCSLTLKDLGDYYRNVTVASRKGYIIGVISLGQNEERINQFGHVDWRNDYDARQRSWYQKAMQVSEPTFSDVYFSVGGKMQMVCFMPYYDKTGVAGVVRVIPSVDNFFTVRKEKERPRGFIMDEHGRVIFSNLTDDFPEVGDNLLDLPEGSSLGLLYAGRNMVAGDTGYQNLFFQGKEYYLSYAPIVGRNWSIGILDDKGLLDSAVEQERSQLQVLLGKMAESFQHLYLILGLVSLVCILLPALAMLYYISKQLSQYFVAPILEFKAAAESIAHGNFQERIALQTKDELEDLSDSFNIMAERIQQYADEVAATIRKETRIRAELELAAQIQAAMLPRELPRQQAVQLSAAMYTAREIGGDFYDYYYLNEDLLAFMVADVTGRAAEAAFFSAFARTLSKNALINAWQRGESEILTATLEEVNVRLSENNESSHFIMAFMGILDIRTGQLRYAHAGYNLSLLQRGTQVLELPRIKNPVLGIMQKAAFCENSCCLQPDDTLFIYTDGVIESMNEAKEMFSKKRLLESLPVGKEPADILADIHGQLIRYMGDEEQYDDIAMMAIHWGGNADGKS